MKGRLLLLTALLLLADAGCRRWRGRHHRSYHRDAGPPDTGLVEAVDSGPPPSSIPMPPATDTACETDAQCPAGQRCADIQMLPFPQRACVPATCRTMWDCRRGRFGRCAEYISGAQCTIGGWACSYPADPCAPQDHTRLCPPQPGMIARCVPRNGRFGCVYEPPPTF